MLRYLKRHKVTVLFVNMGFRDEDKILIKIFQLKGYNARQLRTEFPDYQVKDMVLSQEDQSRTHSTVREISLKTGIRISICCPHHAKGSAADML